MVRRCTFIWLVSLLAVGLVGAKDRYKVDVLIDPETVNRKVSTVVHTVPWHSDFELARKEAQRLHRAIFWVQAKGKLDGST